MAGTFSRNLRLFGVTLGAIFTAELGDKTQLAALTFAADAPVYSWVIFAGAAAAMTLTSLIGVLLGDLLARLVKPRVLNYIAGGIFLVCAGFFVFRFLTAEESAAVAARSAATAWEAFAFTFSAIFVAELGDKTQLATLALAAGNRQARWVVFAGSALALVVASALACLVGGLAGEYLHSRYIGLAVALVFAVLGVAFLLGRAEKGRREFAWLVEQIEKLYEDPECRNCARLKRFLEHVRSLRSEVVSSKVSQLLAPREQWRDAACEQACRVDILHEAWHEKYEHQDATALQKG